MTMAAMLVVARAIPIPRAAINTQLLTLLHTGQVTAKQASHLVSCLYPPTSHVLSLYLSASKVVLSSGKLTSAISK